MIESMTGYGASERNGLKVEMRCVNHRFLDLNIKAPPFFLKHEIGIRNLIKTRFHRGHIDIYVTVAPESTCKISINKEFVKGLIHAVSAIKDEFHLRGEIDFAAILSFKEALVTEMSETPEDVIYEVFNEAIEKLEAMRQQEGQILLGEITSHLDAIDAALAGIREESLGAAERIFERTKSKLKELMDSIPVDDNRLLQEAALLAERYDISEEIQRIGSHLKQFRQNLADNDKIGRKLDFILQELNREANTITSKTDMYSVNALAVQLKAEIEKLREQVQNIQ
ncbi:YicC/YloC family endoribonuclease [Candidatus Magnetominusculus dajiuhuensis]|uniref:YicC/YloC family endoribonuclease n=1 Tax=Candidatus Magnetominusculus dajiuhuensis TaxID=3137712 RepID=UPI003B43532D